MLKVLLLDPGNSFYLRELAQKSDVPLRSAQIEVKRLTDAGILEREAKGRQTYYRINENCPIIPELRLMFIKTVGIADVIRDALLPESDSISYAFIYGSFAKGDIHRASDIDLFVIGNVTLRRLTALLKKVNLYRIINSTVMSEAEFKERKAEGEHFIASLLKSPKIFLIGDEDGLSRLG